MKICNHKHRHGIKSRRQHGFSLVELSIVLVILGLLVGGILGEQALIHAAEMRHLVTDADAYTTALFTYKQKYFAIPGDHKDATKFWPGETENGNGDGLIYDHWNTGAMADEDAKAMEHLSLAGLIPFKPDGVYFPHVAGENFPTGPISGQGYRMQSSPWNVDGDTLYDHEGFSIVMARNWPAYDLYKEFLTPADAWNVDKKMDDGYPETGVIYAHGTAPELCNKNAPAGFGKGDNEYVLDSDEEACNLVYWLK